MYPAYIQLAAKYSSPSIGDQRATGCHLCHIVGMRSAVKHFANVCVVGVGFGVVVAGEGEVRFEM